MSREQFDAAVAFLKTAEATDQSNDRKLQYYKYFKQVTEGDNKGDRPGMFDFTGKAKWDARETVKGMSADEAIKKYLEIVTEDNPDWNK